MQILARPYGAFHIPLKLVPVPCYCMLSLLAAVPPGADAKLSIRMPISTKYTDYCPDCHVSYCSQTVNRLLGRYPLANSNH
jgi:hypothetical protein